MLTEEICSANGNALMLCESLLVERYFRGRRESSKLWCYNGKKANIALRK